MALVTCTAQVPILLASSLANYIFKGGNPQPEVGITFAGRPVGSKEFRIGRNTFTFTGIAKSFNACLMTLVTSNLISFLNAAGVERQDVKIMCTSVNKLGSSNSSVLLHVQTELPIAEESSDHNEEDGDGIEDRPQTRKTSNY